MDALLVEATRGGRAESRHAVHAAVVDGAGALLLAAGDVEAPVFPRSTVKALLALPLVESGAADRLGLTEAALALACASHAGEPPHVDVAAAMLGRAGQGPGCLECGAHWPTGRAGQAALLRADAAPSALHNNCSGKHAGLVCLAHDRGVPPAGYVRPEHPVMREVTAALAELTGAVLDGRNRAVDGCGIPTYAIPLRALAHGFARFGSGVGLHPDRAAAAARLRAAVAAHPLLVAGEGRFDTRLAQLLGAGAFVKMGAEGVHAAAIPSLGLGLAVKCADGGARAAEVAMAGLLAHHLGEAAGLSPFCRPILRGWTGTAVGELRLAGRWPPDGEGALPGPPEARP